jgi:hypothetical protein
MEYDLGTPLRNFLTNIPNDRKLRIAFVIPVWNLLKEEVETLSLPLVNKRAKSPTSIAICNRGSPRNRGLLSRYNQKPYICKPYVCKPYIRKPYIRKPYICKPYICKPYAIAKS